MKAQALALTAVALLAGTAGYVVHRQSLPERPVELPAPVGGAVAAGSPVTPLDWSFADLDGRATPLANWRGKLLVVNFWATWCPPCLREIPAFMDLQARHAERGLQFIGIALDEPAAVAPFVAEKDVNYPVLVGNEVVVRFMQALGNEIGGLPYTAVLSPDGQVLETHQGEWEAAAAAAAIEAHLSAARSAPGTASD